MRRRDRGRLFWWLAAGLPTLLTCTLLLLENAHVPDLSRRRDLSAVLLLLSAALVTAVGLAMAVAAIGRGQQVSGLAQRARAVTSRTELLDYAREMRLRAGWLLLVGVALALFGLCVIGSLLPAAH